MALVPRLAASVRLVLAMFRMYADIETQFGKAVLDILKKQYPDQAVDASPAQVGHKLMAIARKQLQGNDTDAMDAIQNYLTYISTGSASVKDEETGERSTRTEAKPWDFRKDSPTWEEALSKIYSNVRTHAMSGSMTKSRRKKNERSVDDAFGTRDEGGGAPSGGEARIPTPNETALGKALDDHSALREFYGIIDDYLPDLRKSLSPDALKLFDLIFEDDEGSFSSDVKENMGQATALKEKHPDLYEKNAKRWSGFVGDLRKKLLDEIWSFIETHMTPGDYDALKETFFSDVDPSYVRKLEQQKTKGKEDYQRGIDERKVSRLKAQQQEGELDPKQKSELERLTKKLKDQGVDVDAIKADAGAGAKKKKKKSEESRAQQAMSRAALAVASRYSFLRS